jgi:hypothetical protein
MSFVSAYPANLAKLLPYIIADIARARDALVLTEFIMSDALRATETAIVLLPYSDAARAAELMAAGPLGSDTAAGTETVPWRLLSTADRAAFAEAHALGPFTTAEFPKPPPEQYEEDVAIAETELARVARGAPARAAAWRALWRVAFDAMNNFLVALYYLREYADTCGLFIDPIIFRDFFNVADRCWGAVQGYRKPRTGEIAAPRITNDLIHVVRCLKDLLPALWELEEEIASLCTAVRAFGVAFAYAWGVLSCNGVNLTEPGAYFKKPPPVSYTTADVEWASAYAPGVYPYIFNVRLCKYVYPDQKQDERPCVVVELFPGRWAVFWFEEYCGAAYNDWTRTDIGIALRVEVLDRKKYLHVIVINRCTRSANRVYIRVGNITYYLGSFSAYCGAPRCETEFWIALG